MNKLLASLVSLLNGLLAISFVIVGGVSGEILGFKYGGQTLDTLMGLVAGLVVAIIFCGLLALFIDMRRELIHIRKALEKGISSETSV
ncbi:MAG: hypothetical protein POG24_09780 [Acidocella sp.]|nr:hypothetical protein [Acidocella sp.]